MLININDVKNRLISGEEVLLDESILEVDMKSMYEYYREEDDRPPIIDEYFKLEGKFDTKSFCKAYLSDLVGSKVDWQYSEDNWLIWKTV